MFERLKSGISNALHILKGYGQITEVNLGNAVNEIKKALLDADVDYKLTKNLILEIKNGALGKKVLTSLTPDQVFTKIVNDKLVEFMSCGDNDIKYTSSPTIILLVGLQGVGKTTFAAKLSNYIKKIDGRNPLLVACDIYRPAAIKQLSILAELNGLDFFTNENENNVVNIIKEALKQNSNKNDVIIIDTAGRLTLDDKMMNELKNINENFKINEVLLALDSTIGQISIKTAKDFDSAIQITGFVLTKTDSDTKGGVALSVTASTQKPIKFISSGEKIDDIELFHADRIVNRILGKGDIVSLVEKVERQFSKEESKNYLKNIQKGNFNFEDFLAIQKKINNMGGMMNLFKFLPNMQISEKQKQEGLAKLKKTENIINSMTIKERKNYCTFDFNRKRRIAKGCGMEIKDVEEVIKMCENMKKMFENVKNKKMFF